MSWNIGNTSVRNPWRIRDGLRVFYREFNGNLDGHEQEALFLNHLVEEGVVESEQANAEYRELHGRKWRSCFCKLGFITKKDYRKMPAGQVSLADLTGHDLATTGRSYELTPAGRRLLEADNELAVADVFLRQLLKLEVTSPTEEEPEQVKLKPLVLLLQLLSLLEEENSPGLSQSEIAAFVQTATDHEDVRERVEKILDNRARRESLVGRVKRLTFDKKQIEEQRVNGLHPKAETLRDYADTTSRYCRMTGLLTFQGNRIIIREEKKQLVNEILKTQPILQAAVQPLEYLVDFYTGTLIPTDDAAIALEEIRAFEEKLVARGIEPVVRVAQLVQLDAKRLAQARYKAEGQFLLVLEDDFASRQAEDDQIEEVITYLQKLNGIKGLEVTIEDEPAFLEWSVWRALLALDHLAVRPHETRNFRLGADLRPVGCAPSGKPDIMMDYGEFVVVVEVTMTKGSRQEAAEGEPVRRHVANVLESTSDKEVYGLFVAPSVDNNTAETFRVGIWYRKDEPNYLNIVPLTVDQLIAVLRMLKKTRMTPKDLKALLDRCLVFRNAFAPKWLKQIDTEVSRLVSA